MHEVHMFKILLIDDDEDTVDLTKTILEQRLYEVRSVGVRDSVAEAVVTEFSPHAIILDYWMPGATADEFIASIRRTHPQMQFILVTGMVNEAIALANKLGVAVLIKPFEPEKLIEVIER